MKSNEIAVAYCRTATILEDGHSSLIEQSSRCIQKALEDGYRKVECIVDVRSGMSRKRFINRELKSLRRLIRSHKVGQLYITSPCRLSRDQSTFLQLTNYCKKYEVKIVICDSL